MLYCCYGCNHYSFEQICHKCGEDKKELYVPLDPKFYPEFQYQSQGFVKDLFLKKKTQNYLNETLDNVLVKYKKFKIPYFVNYLHIARENSPDQRNQSPQQFSSYSKLNLFHQVLTSLGFDELNKYEHLTDKLIKSTEFSFNYSNFIIQTKKHIQSDFTKSLYSWICERGALFRKELPLFIYYLWEHNEFLAEIEFNYIDGNKESAPLITQKEFQSIENKCERIYLDILIERFKITLEKFDPDKYFTIYKVDSMSGYEFEDFLAELFSALGYDVEKTKRSQDQGADLFATHFGKRIVIQAKNYSDNVGNSAVQQVLSAKTFYGCDESMVITNRYFTNSAVELAKSADVKLINRDKLIKYIDEYNQMIIESSSEKKQTNV